MAFASDRDDAATKADFHQKAEAFLASVPAAGFEPRELEVEVAGHTVTVRGRRPGTAFGRQLHLPADADPDDLTASLDHGVLCLRARREPALRRPVPVEESHGLFHSEAAAS